MAVDRCQGIDRFGVLAANQDPIGMFQIVDGRAFGQEFRVGEHRKGCLAPGPLGRGEDRLHGFGRAHRQGAFFNHDRVALGAGGHLAGRGFDPAQVTGLAGTDAASFGGGVHREKHHIGAGNRRFHRSCEMEVAAPATAHHRIEPWLIDRQAGEIRIVPGGNASLVEIDHRHLDGRAVVGDHRHGGPAHIASPNAANLANGRWLPGQELGELGGGAAHARAARKWAIVGSRPWSRLTVGCQPSCSRARSITG